jgi:hypothetical protein
MATSNNKLEGRPLNTPNLERVPQPMAEALLRNRGAVIHAVCVTDGGGGACLPCMTLEPPFSDDDLGAAVRDILTASAAAPLPDDFERESRKVLKAAGVSSWRRLSEGAVCCSISAHDGRIFVTPSQRNAGSFIHLSSGIVEIAADAEAETFGVAVREAWSRSK